MSIRTVTLDNNILGHNKYLLREARVAMPQTIRGDSAIANYKVTSTITANNLNTITPVYTVPAGRTWLLNSINVFADRDCEVLIRIAAISTTLVNQDTGITPTDTEVGTYQQFWGVIEKSEGGNFTVVFPQPKILNEWTTVKVAYWRNDTAGAYVDASLDYIDLTNDQNYEASNVLLSLTDSYGHDTKVTGVNLYGDQYWPYIVTNNLVDASKSVRLVNKGFGGGISYTAAQLVRNHYIDFPFDCLMVSLGYNDISIANATWTASRRALYKTAMKTIIDQAIRTGKRYGKTPTILLFKPYKPKVSDTNRTANYVDCGTALQELKDTFYSGNANVVIGSFSGVDNEANFAADAVHVNGTGQANLGVQAWTEIQTTPFYSSL